MTSSKYPIFPILLVDDEVQALQSFGVSLRSAGINNIFSCQDSRDVIPMLSKQKFEVVLLDLWMPHVSGEEILSVVMRDFPDIPVIIITGVNEVETAVKCMKAGAFDYMVKPVEKSRLISGVIRAIELQELQRENIMLRDRILSKKLDKPEVFSSIITRNEAMLSIFQYVEAIANTLQPVLITGETGVGKELIAVAIHKLSDLQGSFTAVNVAGLDDNVFADTLFGHKKGAFTGADSTRAGMIEQASGGTLFLDEIGDLNISSQVKLLRLLQEREYFPLGSDIPKRTDARIIVATNQDIHQLQQSGKLRKDLYYRLRTHHVHIPALHERMDDLHILIEHFLQEASKELGKKKPTVPKELFALLGIYHFPGNIRELRSMIFDALSNHKSGMLSLETFRKAIGQRGSLPMKKHKESTVEKPSSILFSEELPTLKQAENLLINEAMRRAKGSQSIAAQMLGITRQALNRRLKKTEK